MAHRIELKQVDGSLRIDFEGVLDRSALGEITALARNARDRARGGEVALVLQAGTEVDPECIEPLRRLEGVTVRATSAFLARWLLGAR